MDTDEIRFAEQRVEITALDIPFGGEGFRPVGVETSDAASETLGDGRHAASDGPHAHDAECAPLHFAPEDGALFPFAAAHPGIAARDLPEQAEQQGEGVLRDRHVVGPGRVADGDVPGDGGGYVDHVEARSELGDAAEVGQGVEQSGVEMEIVPGNHDVRALEAAHEGGIVHSAAPAVQNLHIRAGGQTVELFVGKGREGAGF